MQSGLDTGQGDGEQHADHHDRGDHRRLQRLVAEHQHAQRNPDIAGVGVGRTQRIQAGVDQRLLLQHAIAEGEGEHAEAADGERGDKARLPELLPGRGRDDAEQQRRQAQPDHESIEFGGAGRPHPPATTAQVTEQDQRKDGQDDIDDRRHGLSSASWRRSAAPRPKRPATIANAADRRARGRSGNGPIDLEFQLSEAMANSRWARPVRLRTRPRRCHASAQCRRGSRCGRCSPTPPTAPARHPGPWRS